MPPRTKSTIEEIVDDDEGEMMEKKPAAAAAAAAKKTVTLSAEDLATLRRILNEDDSDKPDMLGVGDAEAENFCVICVKVSKYMHLVEAEKFKFDGLPGAFVFKDQKDAEAVFRLVDDELRTASDMEWSIIKVSNLDPKSVTLTRKQPEVAAPEPSLGGGGGSTA